MMPSVLNTDAIMSVQNATGVPNVPKMTMNHPRVPKSYYAVQQKHLLYQPGSVYQT